MLNAVYGFVGANLDVALFLSLELGDFLESLVHVVPLFVIQSAFSQNYQKYYTFNFTQARQKNSRDRLS